MKERQTFTKKDFQNGDIVVTRGGEPGVVIVDKEMILFQNGGFDCFDMFTDDLMSDDEERQCDIMRVYQGDSLFGFEDYCVVNLVFDRKEEPALKAESKEVPVQEENRIPVLPEKKESGEKPIFVMVQAIYGNRTCMRVRPENMDKLILGYLDYSLPVSGKIDRTIIPVPGAENLIIIYNRYQEEKRLQERDRLLAEGNVVFRPLAVIHELGLCLYSRCLVCRINEEGGFESLEEEDLKEFLHYLSE